MKKIFVKVFLILIILVFFELNVGAIESIEMEIQKNNPFLMVKAHILPSLQFIEGFKNGLSKNIFILIELYRVWHFIPDEFIEGFQMQRALISDPIKDEFIIKTIQDNNISEKRFKNWQEALDLALKIEPVKITNAAKLDRGDYYVKITVESNIRKLPLILEHILFFIPTYEKKITKISEKFSLP